MGKNNASRRKVLGVVGSNIAAFSAISGMSMTTASGATCPVPPCPDDPDNGQEREVMTATTSHTGPEMRGNGDFTVTLASTVIEHVPIWAPSIEQWECDISLSGIAYCEFVDDGSPANEMMYHSCGVSDKQYGKDLYTRDDPDWCGIKKGEGRQPPDYSEFSNVESALAIGVGALNPAAGTAIGSAVLLKDMIAGYGGGGVGRKWDVDSPLGGPTQHLTGYYHKYRAEMDSNEVTVHDLHDLAMAYPEYPVKNTFEIIMGALSTPPDEMSDQELERNGVRRYDPDDTIAVQSASPHVQSAVDRHDEPIYAAYDTQRSIRLKPDSEPGKLREEYPELDW